MQEYIHFSHTTLGGCILTVNHLILHTTSVLLRHSCSFGPLTAEAWLPFFRPVSFDDTRAVSLSVRWPKTRSSTQSGNARLSCAPSRKGTR